VYSLHPRTKKTKNKLVTPKAPEITYLGSRNPWTDRYKVMHVGCPLWLNHACQFLWSSVNGFWRGEGWNFGLFIDFLRRLYNTGAKVGDWSAAKRGKIFILVVLLHFMPLKVQLVFLVIAFMMVSTVWSVSCLLIFYSRCPHALWSRHSVKSIKRMQSPNTELWQILGELDMTFRLRTDFRDRTTTIFHWPPAWSPNYYVVKGSQISSE